MKKQMAGTTAVFIIGGILVMSFMGCEALGKKFIRKPKNQERVNEPVLVPQEYPSLYKTPEEAYKQYLFYWKSWQDEFINSLLYRSSSKKRATCVEEAAKNLSFLRNLLTPEKQQGVDEYIRQLMVLKDAVSKDTFAMSSDSYRMTAEKLRRNILRDYSYNAVKEFVIDDFGTN